jgi:hypothetical protein
MKKKTLLFVPIFLFLLACRAAFSLGQPRTHLVGYDLWGQSPQVPTGDRSAAGHVFIHKYPFTTDGYVTGVSFLNDSDGGSEVFALLVLRPLDDGWLVVHHLEIEGDDQPPSKTGVTTIHFTTPLSVEKGDVFGHWQFDDTGPIPMNLENHSIDGLSFGKSGFIASDVDTGRIISREGFSGGRDYFINLLFQSAP